MLLYSKTLDIIVKHWISCCFTVNIGALCLKALYEHWPEACTNQNAEDGDDASSISSGKSLSNRVTQHRFSLEGLHVYLTITVSISLIEILLRPSPYSDIHC